LPAELIICDDPPDDATVDIIKRFSETAPFPVKLVVNEQRLGGAETSAGTLAKIAVLSKFRFVPVGAFARL
jgi:hypothetical protein